MTPSTHDVPVSLLRRRLIDDMTMRRFSRETQRNYIRDVGRFAMFLGRPPDTATAEDLRRFQVEQRDAGVPAPTMNSIVAALRFFFTNTLDRPDLARKLVRRDHHCSCPAHLRCGIRSRSLRPHRTWRCACPQAHHPIRSTATTGTEPAGPQSIVQRAQAAVSPARPAKNSFTHRPAPGGRGFVPRGLSYAYRRPILFTDADRLFAIATAHEADAHKRGGIP